MYTTHQRAMFLLLLLLLLLQQEISVVFLYFFVSAIKARCAARPCWNVLPRCIPRCRQQGGQSWMQFEFKPPGPRIYLNHAVSQHTQLATFSFPHLNFLFFSFCLRIIIFIFSSYFSSILFFLFSQEHNNLTFPKLSLLFFFLLQR